VAGVCALALAGCATPGVRNSVRTFDTVVLDAGHGGIDSGAIGRNGVREKQVALDVTRRVDGRLRAAGFKTVLVRDRDVFVPLDTRASLSNREHDAIFVSIHFNHTRARTTHGTETYYIHPYGQMIADRIQSHLVRQQAGKDRGVKRANFRVLRLNLNPAVLVECGFLSNGREARLAASPAHREKIAACIAHALTELRWPNRPLNEPAFAYPAPSPER